MVLEELHGVFIEVNWSPGDQGATNPGFFQDVLGVLEECFHLIISLIVF